MTFWASGKIECSLKKPKSNQVWWMVLRNIDENIGCYYRYLYWLDHNKGQKLARPYWGSHITIVRNEIPPHRDLWWNYHGEEIKFEYFPDVHNNWSPERYRSFYWLNVRCPRFDQIRVELGLDPNPDGLYHVTIGSVENAANKDRYEAMWDKSN